MNIFEIGIARGEELGAKRGEERGIEKDTAQTLVKNIDSVMKNLGIDLQQACEALGASVEEYENAKKELIQWVDAHTTPSDTNDVEDEPYIL